MLPQEHFESIIRNWYDKILSLEPEEMHMSEALLSLTLAELGHIPVSTNIKYLGKEKTKSPFNTIGFEYDDGEKSYDIATHYYGDTRWKMKRDYLLKIR